MKLMRKQNCFEKVFTSGYTSVQLAMKLKNPSKDLIPILKNLEKNVIGLHTKVINDMLYYDDAKTPIYPLPKGKSLEDCCYYTAKHYMRPVNQALGSLAANDDTIVLNLNHAASDGGYMSRLYSYLKDGKDIGCPKFIRNIEEELENEMSQSKMLPYTLLTNPHLTRMVSHDSLMYTNAHNNSAKGESQISNLQVYNKQTGKVKGLTEAFIVNQILAASAFNGSFDKKGVNVNIDIRPFMKNPDFSLTNAYSYSPIYCDGVTKDTTVEDFMKIARKMLNEKIKNREFFSTMEASRRFSDKKMPQDIVIDFSNIGQFEVGGPFSDVWPCVTRAGSSAKPQICFFTFSIKNKNKNNLYSRVRYSRFNFSENEADLITKSVHYGLENIPLNSTCEKALSIMKEYQEYLKQNYLKPKFI